MQGGLGPYKKGHLDTQQRPREKTAIDKPGEGPVALPLQLRPAAPELTL